MRPNRKPADSPATAAARRDVATALRTIRRAAGQLAAAGDRLKVAHAAGADPVGTYDDGSTMSAEDWLAGWLEGLAGDLQSPVEELERLTATDYRAEAAELFAQQQAEERELAGRRAVPESGDRSGAGIAGARAAFDRWEASARRALEASHA